MQACIDYNYNEIQYMEEGEEQRGDATSRPKQATPKGKPNKPKQAQIAKKGQSERPGRGEGDSLKYNIYRIEMREPHIRGPDQVLRTERRPEPTK